MASRLNYTTHAIEDLRDLLRHGIFSGADQTTIDEIIDQMRRAQKFMLPDRGELIFSKGNIPAETEVFRLPFPITLVEFPFTARDGEIQPNIETMSSRRLAIAIEGNIVTDHNGRPIFAPEVGGTGYAVRTVSYIDKYRRWCPMAAQAFVSYGEKTVAGSHRFNATPYSQIKTESATPFVLMPALQDQYQKSADDPKLGINSLSNDVAREVNILTEFLAVVSCGNVGSSIQSPPKALSRARSGKKKEPLYDYHILTIDGLSDSGSGGSSPSGTGGPQVRTHLRRGHIRRLHDSGRRIWVNATIVAPGSALGVAEKIYRVASNSTGTLSR